MAPIDSLRGLGRDRMASDWPISVSLDDPLRLWAPRLRRDAEDCAPLGHWLKQTDHGHQRAGFRGSTIAAAANNHGNLGQQS